MHFVALAADYDGTLATQGSIDPATVAALRRLRDSGRRLLMVTGRELDELKQVCPHLDLFDRVVAENGGLIFKPKSGEIVLLTESPSPEFVNTLRQAGCERVAVGRSIVATWEPHQTTVLECIRQLGLELEIIFNKGAVMILPTGVNKATGLAAALTDCGLAPLNTVAIGDAENDHIFLKACGCGVAVANAIPALKETADLVTEGDHGAGVQQLIDRLIERDLADVPLQRHRVALGQTAAGPLPADPRGAILVAGTSGSGKSTLVNGFLERLRDGGHQFCVIDPEGDYENFDGALIIGDPQSAPSPNRVLEALAQPSENVIVNLLGIAHADRPAFFALLLPDLLKLRARSARPHWLVIDEAHHMLPAERNAAEPGIPPGFAGFLLVTVHPEAVAPALLKPVDTMLIAGQAPGRTLAEFCTAAGLPTPSVDAGELASGEMLLWRRAAPAPEILKVIPAKAEHRRHVRKYAQGALSDQESFYFRGPSGALNLKAQNLMIFLQLAEGVDEATWLHHLRAGDYSRWFADSIKDGELAAEAAAIERRDLDADESRRLMAKAVMRRYTAPEAAARRSA